MHRVTTVDELESLIGTPPQMVLMKATRALDEGCRSVLAASPVAGFGYRDVDGVPHSTLIGGEPGFARAVSTTQLTFELASDEPGPVGAGGVSFVFLLPGVGETLRLNGAVADRTGTSVAIDLEDAYVHCAKCILRSQLWHGPTGEGTSGGTGAVPGSGPLTDPEVSGFVAQSPFAVVSSWDATGASDTSPKGDPAGFIRMLDGETLAIPNRKGNRRADTFHNLLTCDDVALAATVPGRDELLHLRGSAYVTDDRQLLSTMALGERPPTTALVVSVIDAEIRRNQAIAAARLWDPSTHDPLQAPDMNRIATQHLAASRAPGAKASMTRTLSRGLGAAPSKLVRRAIDAGYRKDLKDEGYDDR